ncbi:MAG TPA: hypothetical protein VLB49_17480 [Gemmatimonadales bacterium]|nr:hypothetical protein [Gemmatimonadales bacterium]
MRAPLLSIAEALVVRGGLHSLKTDPGWLHGRPMTVPIRGTDGTLRTARLRAPWPWVLRKLSRCGYLDASDLE